MVKNSPLDRECQRLPLIDMRAVHMAFGAKMDKVYLNEQDVWNEGMINYYTARKYQTNPHHDCMPERGLCYAKKENCDA